MKPANLAVAFAVLVSGLALGASASAEPATRPVVVELFTSQGCSSCPPADAVLAEVARRPDVLALGFHVDYWDKLGWKDPLSAPGATRRQNDYAGRFGRSEVYTPQIVVDGRTELIGSHRDAVLQAIGSGQRPADVTVTFAVDGRSVLVGPGAAGRTAGSGSVIAVRYLRDRTTVVARGENAGRTAHDVNGVETLRPLGKWSGPAQSFPIDPPDAAHGLAVLVQAEDGSFLGAAALAPGNS
jgi:hypothetical protein